MNIKLCAFAGSNKYYFVLTKFKEKCIHNKYKEVDLIKSLTLET